MSETDMTDYAELRAALNAGPKGKWKVQRPNAGVRGLEVATNCGLNQIAADLTEPVANYIAACDPDTIRALLEERDELAKDAARYAIARRMSPQQWADAWELNHRTGKPFDEIIDDLAPFFDAAMEGAK